jgi:uncharacterized protein YbbK (DUF523 family)
MPPSKLNSTTAISACLLGIPCRWNQKGKLHPDAFAAFAHGNALVVCPEVFGGMSTPRPACEIVGGDGRDVLAGMARVVDVNGHDYTQQFIAAAEKTLSLLQDNGITKIILKSGSPSCGAGTIYTGNFNGTTKDGVGVFTALLQKHNIDIIAEL